MDLQEELESISERRQGSYIFLTRDVENLKIAIFEYLFDNKSAISFDFVEPASDKVEDIRQALNKMNQKSVYGLKVFFLSNFSNLSRVVQNTLLKNLEETRPGEIFILQSNNLQGILLTILSRCQKIKLKDQNLDGEKPFFLDRNLDLRIWWEKKPKNLNELREILESWIHFSNLDLNKKQKLIKNYKLVKKINVNLDLFWINLYADLKIR